MKTIDLFAGIGGIRRGFELGMGTENVISAENNSYACKTYESFYGENPFADITSEEFKKKVEETNYDVLLGGFPCQTFSMAGKRQGFKDKTKGTLFFDVADIIERTRPKIVFLENVEGLLSHDKGQTFKTILETLVIELKYKVLGAELNEVTGELEYDKKDFLVNTKNFGLPQNRPRIFIVGFSTETYKDANKKLKGVVIRKSSEKQIYKDLTEVLDTNVGEKYYLSSGYMETLNRHRGHHKGKGNGFGYQVVNETGIKSPRANALLATGGSGKERNLISDPRPELYGKMVKGKKTEIGKDGIRAMTPIEWGKLQGFINYGFKENGVDKIKMPANMSDAQLYKQFGNSVSIPAIEEVAKQISELIDVLTNKKK